MKPSSLHAAAVLAWLSTLPFAGAARAAEFGLHGSINLGVGDYSDENSARTGLGGGFDINAPIGSNAAWTTSVNLLFNSLDEPEGMPSGVDLGQWVNLPLLTGIRFQGGDHQAKGYFQAQGGLNMGSQTSSTDGSNTVSVDWAPSFGFGLGAGLMVGSFHAGARFYKVGEAEHTITINGPMGGGEGTG